MQKFLSLFSRNGDAAPSARPQATEPAPVVLAPDQQLYVIGDVHGQSELLKELLQKIDAHLSTTQDSNPLLLFVGDLVDRGENSARVLTHVHNLCTHMGDNVACLMGNHERMLLQFLDDPLSYGQRWMRSGGLQTLASFGLHGGALGMSDETLTRLAADLRLALPEAQETWMRGLPLYHQSGNVLCVHAAADPELPAAAQSDKVLLWGQSGFMQRHRHDGLCVVHGHTVVDAPQHAPTRISIDTGAYFSGHLTAAAISPNGALSFLTTGS